jgi:glycosyltransferase involved in cell wall biosynthesis
LHESGCPAALAIVGEGDDRPRLEALIAKLGLQDSVRLLGYRTDLVNLYEAFDVFALSSYREGLPNVVLEAMALETPVVATAIAGVPKLITGGCDGLLVPAGDAAALAAALQRIFADPTLHRRLATEGRATIERRFAFDRRMEKVARLYDEVLQGGSTP